MDNAKYTVLIVDDVSGNVKLASEILEREGYSIRSANNGMSAIKIVRTEKIDLILLDIMMPKMGGIETCKHLKSSIESQSVPVIFFTASDDKETLTQAYNVGGVDYIKKPFFKEELLARVNLHISLRDYEKNLEEKVEEKTQEIVTTQVQLMYILGSIADGHSTETQLHVQRVSEVTYLLAKLYGLSEEESIILKDASTLHDIGKLGIPSNIIHKKGTLTDDEFKEMKRHPVIGAEMLSDTNLPLFKAASIVCMQHHEQYNGMGYPKGLKGKNIHIYGRIVSLADVFDALLFKRSYKESWTQEKVLEYIKKLKGSFFDPTLIDIFFANIDQFLAIYDEHLNKKISIEKEQNSFVDSLKNLFKRVKK
jgi:putative two-component system response regulator